MQAADTALISIVMPVYNPDLLHVSSAIDSVRAQIYENWELCIADDASTDASVARTLKQYATADSRIKVTFRERNGHIAACSNSAMELATGEWVALLDQDDLLAEHALAVVAATIVEHPEAGLIYSDEDKIDQSGVRSSPSSSRRMIKQRSCNDVSRAFAKRLTTRQSRL